MQRKRTSVRMVQELLIIATYVRYLLAGVTQLAPASVVIAVSCGLNCSTRCESGSIMGSCYVVPVSNCSDASAAPCSVRTACHCAGMSSTNPEPSGCNVAACNFSATQAACLQTSGCEWSDACQERYDCNSLDENGCKANSFCYWIRDCG